MYRLARRGEAPEIPEREVEIFEISQLSCLSDDTFKIDVHVSKGTNIWAAGHAFPHCVVHMRAALIFRSAQRLIILRKKIFRSIL